MNTIAKLNIKWGAGEAVQLAVAVNKHSSETYDPAEVEQMEIGLALSCLDVEIQNLTGRAKKTLVDILIKITEALYNYQGDEVLK